MKEQIQLHEIACYLPYALNCQYQFISKITGHTELRIGNVLGLKQGLHEIQILINNKSNDPVWEKIDLNTKPILRSMSDLTDEMAIKSGYKDASALRLMVISKLLPYQGFQNLFQNHYDVFSLISRGLATDINLIKQ